MRSILVSVVLLLLSPHAHAQSWQQQECGKGQMPTPNGCMQVCQPGYVIGKQNGYDTCLREGNAEVGTHQRKYAFLPIAAGNNVDGICFGIRADERVETVVDDRFVEADWHVQPHQAYVAQISYKLDPGLTKLHLIGFRYWRADENRKPVGVGDLIAVNTEVPLYDAPQANWPCSKQQWVTIMTPPQVHTVAPPGYSRDGAGVSTYSPSGAPYSPPTTPPRTTPMCRDLSIMSRYGSGCTW